jgi:hypothetical protein
MWSLWPNIRFLPSIVAEKNVTKNILEGRTDRGKTVYPPPPSGSGGIIRSKIGSKCVDLILIGLAKCWNNFFFFKILYTIILWKCQVGIYFVLLSSQRFRIKIFFRKKTIKLKLNSLRGKLIKKNLQDQNSSPIYQQKNEIKLWS